MNNLWLKIKVWTKVIILALILIYAILFALKNQDPVQVWFWFGPKSQSPVAMALFVAFLSGGLAMFMVRTIWGTWRQMRDMNLRQRQAKVEKDLAEMKAKAQPAGQVKATIKPPAAP